MNINDQYTAERQAERVSQLPLSSFFYSLETYHAEQTKEQWKKEKGEYQFLYWE